MRRALAALVDSFDLVHVHAIYLWPTWAAARAARAHGVPYVVVAARHAGAGADPAQEPLGEGGVDRADRARQPRGGRGHPRDVAVEAATFSASLELPPVATIPHGVDDPPPPSAAPLSADIAAATSPGPLGAGRISWEKGSMADRGAAAGAGGAVVLAGDDGEARLRRWRRRRARSASTRVCRALSRAPTRRRCLPPRGVCHDLAVGEFRPGRFRGDAAGRAGAGDARRRHVGDRARERRRRVVDPRRRHRGGLNACSPTRRQSRHGRGGPRACVAHYGWPSVARRMADLYRLGLRRNGRHDGAAGAKPVRRGDRAPGRDHRRLAAAGFRRGRPVHADARAELWPSAATT